MENSCDYQKPSDFYEKFTKNFKEILELSNSIVVMLYKMFTSALGTPYDIE